jgi:hypothetical protein
LPKVRISITIEKQLADEIEKHYRSMLKKALDQNAEHLPKLANLYEQLVLEAWEKKKKK